MTELYLIIRLSVKPQNRVSEQIEVLSILDKKIQIVHYVLYATTIFVFVIYTYQVIELIILVEQNLVTNKSFSEVIDSADVKGFKSFYSWTSCILLILFALALFIVFLMLNRTLRDNLLTQSTRRDKQILNRLFGIFVFAYLVESIYFWFFGRFNDIVCSVVLRWIGQDFVALLCDIPAGIAIFHLHNLNYKE